MKKVSKISLSIFLVILLSAASAYAGTAAPWDSGIQKFLDLFQGKIAIGIFFVIAIAATWKIVMGGELDEFTRKMLVGVIAVSSIIAIVGLFDIIFGTAGFILT